MIGKIEYLEKYSVAPSPSRDYYGLKVILYLWKISHGPHKTPIVRSSSFVDFEQDKSLQDEIRRAFGKHLLRHVRNIAVGQRNTLLTLPRNLIDRLVGYLTVNDIVKLVSLSHVAKEIFSHNSVWETLYKKYKPLMKRKNEKLHATTHDWKQLFQLEQIGGLMNEPKVPHARLAPKQTKTNLRLEDSSKHYNTNSRGSTKIVPSLIQSSKKLSEETRRKAVQNPISKKTSDIRLDRSIIGNEKNVLEKKVPIIKSLQLAGKKSTKVTKDQSKYVAKNESKRDVENRQSFTGKVVEVKSNRSQNTQIKIRKSDTKISSTSVEMIEGKSSTGKLSNLQQSKALRIEKSASSTLTDQSKSKAKIKTKKVTQSKSTILNTSTALAADYSSIRDDRPDLADLIEACLKNSRCPRSIFDYNGSCFDKPKSCGDGKAPEEYRQITEIQRILKSGRVRTSLDRLSEKSEPSTAKSGESAGRSEVSGASILSKNTKVSKTKTKKSAESNKNDCKVVIPEGEEDIFDRYGVYSKNPSPRTNASVEDKRPKSTDKMSMQRFLELTRPYGKKGNVGKPVDVNRYQMRKVMDSVYKH
ncbi:uncharacterized protein LOC128884578 [Hylaeus volcanicus]|uniref:uncharacterized protein LOC128884578 n=1 Tax=Hylaeus volcanicus TaxID=313075 RepID=UPI0023B7A581|nr:uncharacterized protein LOC128884578 [Hylaeus volcanicus]